MKKLKTLIIMGGIAANLTACSNPKEEPKVQKPTEIKQIVGVARIEPEKGLLYIYSYTNGKVKSLNAIENQEVSQGNILLSLENSTDEAQLKIEESKINAQNSAIQSAEMTAKSTLIDLQKANKDFELNEQLFEAKAITKQALNDSKTKADKLKMDYEMQLSEVSQKRNKTLEINANIQYRKAILEEKTNKASFNGKVLQWDVHKGDYITTGQKLGQFAPSGSLVAVTEVDELFAGKVKLGLKAQILSQANGEKIGDGEVVFVGEFLKKKSLFSDETIVEDRRVKEVKIRLNPTDKIMINNRVDCVIILN